MCMGVVLSDTERAPFAGDYGATRGSLHEQIADEAGGAAARDAIQPLWDQLLTRTDTRWAGWTIVDGSDERAAAIAALEAVARGLEKVVPAAPPATGDKVVTLGGAQSR